MSREVDDPKEHGRRFVDGFTPGQKAVTVLGVVAVVIAGVTFARWASKPDYSPLYSGLSAAEAVSVTAALNAQHVPYRVSGGGGTVLVPRGSVDSARTDLAAENIPAGVGSNPSGAAATGGTNSPLAQTQAYDAALEQRIEDMVSSTLGPGHVAVTVAAQLDTSKRSSVTTNYGEVYPGTSVPITQNDSQESSIGPSGGSTGSSTQHHNAVDSTVTNSDTPPGTLKRLSVSVLLDSAVVTPAQVASVWRPSIQTAAGIDPARDGNNALKVITVAFSKTARKSPAQLAGTTTSDRLIDVAKGFLTLLMLAVVLYVAWLAMRRAERNRADRRRPLDLLELEGTRPGGAVTAPATAVARVGAPSVRESIDADAAPIELEIAELIERQPDEVAQTLRSWLADRRA
jgi:flagellar M-ring protein FliF